MIGGDVKVGDEILDLCNKRYIRWVEWYVFIDRWNS